MQSKIEVTNLIGPILNFYAKTKDEFSNLLELGLREYLTNQTDKYYYINTFLYRTKKIEFFKSYFPIKCKHKLLITEFDNIKDVLDEYRYVLIIGSAGSGKSTLAKFIYLNSLQKLFKIPIYIELRHLNSSLQSLREYLLHIILKNKVKPSELIASRYLERGDFLIILDGYDEISYESKEKINIQIERFIDLYPHNRYILTSRPSYDAESVQRFKNFYIQNLEKKDVLTFITKIVEDKERKKRLYDLLNSEKINNYFNYLQNPLLLSMFILAFEKHPEIPNKYSSFYRNVYDTLYSRHDGITKGSFKRERKTSLFKEDFEEILKIFCYINFVRNKYSFTVEDIEKTLSKVKKYKPELDFKFEDLIFDLRTTISILIKEGFEYKFPHRSMQEYFAVNFISQLPEIKRHEAYLKILNSYDFSSIFTNKFSLAWTLCDEIDPNSFKKYFLLPELKSIAVQLNNEDKIDDHGPLFKKVFEVFKLQFAYQPIENEQGMYSDVFCVSYNPNSKIKVLRYCNILKNDFFVFRNEEMKKLEKLFYPNGNFDNNYSVGEFIRILYESGFVKKVETLFIDTNKLIKKFESNISDEESEIDSILGLT